MVARSRAIAVTIARSMMRLNSPHKVLHMVNCRVGMCTYIYELNPQHSSESFLAKRVAIGL